jgi:hypothetical protein
MDMPDSSRHRLPPLGLGLASVVLGAIGLLLFIVPILAAPISGCGMIAGACGIMGGVAGLRVDLRLCVAGVALCALALAIDLAVQYAPGGYLGRPADSQILAPETRRPYVPPPAPFRGAFAGGERRMA